MSLGQFCIDEMGAIIKSARAASTRCVIPMGDSDGAKSGTLFQGDLRADMVQIMVGVIRTQWALVGWTNRRGAETCTARKVLKAECI